MFLHSLILPLFFLFWCVCSTDIAIRSPRLPLGNILGVPPKEIEMQRKIYTAIRIWRRINPLSTARILQHISFSFLACL